MGRKKYLHVSKFYVFYAFDFFFSNNSLNLKFFVVAYSEDIFLLVILA